jgi:hypothetical protein
MASSSPFLHRERKRQFTTRLPFGRALVVIYLAVPIDFFGITLLERGDEGPACRVPDARANARNG